MCVNSSIIQLGADFDVRTNRRACQKPTAAHPLARSAAAAQTIIRISGRPMLMLRSGATSPARYPASSLSDSMTITGSATNGRSILATDGCAAMYGLIARDISHRGHLGSATSTAPAAILSHVPHASSTRLPGSRIATRIAMAAANTTLAMQKKSTSHAATITYDAGFTTPPCRLCGVKAAFVSLEQ